MQRCHNANSYNHQNMSSIDPGHIQINFRPQHVWWCKLAVMFRFLWLFIIYDNMYFSLYETTQHTWLSWWGVYCNCWWYIWCIYVVSLLFWRMDVGGVSIPTTLSDWLRTLIHIGCVTHKVCTHTKLSHTHTPFTYEVAHHLCVCGVCDVGNCISRLLDQVAVSTFIEGRWPRKVPGWRQTSRLMLQCRRQWWKIGWACAIRVAGMMMSIVTIFRNCWQLWSR